MKYALTRVCVYTSTLMTAYLCVQAADAAILEGANSASFSEYKDTSTLPSIHEFPIVSEQDLVAQITPDSTLGDESSSVLIQEDGNNIRVRGGAERGPNLFHSFGEFNVNLGQEVRFENSTGADNIFSRVTGQSISNIDGLMGIVGANGQVARGNLFFLNPNGIIFGPEAKLELDGILTVSIDEAFAFTDGSEFGTETIANDPLLSTSVPLGVQFNVPSEQEGLFSPELQNDSLFVVSTDGIQVSNQLDSEFSRVVMTPNFIRGLLANDENYDAVILKTPEAVRFKGPIDENDVGRMNNASVNDEPVNDIQNFSSTDFRVFASNINIEDTRITQEKDGSIVLSTPQSPQNSISIQSIRNEPDEVGVGERPTNFSELFTFDDTPRSESGDISITTGVLNVDRARIVSLNSPNGSSGNIDVDASEAIILTGDSRLSTGIEPDSETENMSEIENVSGNITIETDLLQVKESSFIASSTQGKGDAGRIVITADRVTLDNIGFENTGIFSRVLNSANGDGGDISISASSLRILGGARITTESLSQGDAGMIQIDVDEDIEVSDGSTINASSSFQGDAGLVEINANNLYLHRNASVFSRLDSDENTLPNNDGDSNGNPTGPDNESGNKGTGKGISITLTGSLQLVGSRITSDTLTEGNAGSIDIVAPEGIVLQGFTPEGNGDQFITSTIGTSVGASERWKGISGDGGFINIEIARGALEILDSSRIVSSTFAEGDARSIDIKSNAVIINDLDISGTDNSEDSIAGIYSRVEPEGNDSDRPAASGNSGGITITTNSLTMLNDSRVTTTTAGSGEPGLLSISATEIYLSGSELSSELSAEIVDSDRRAGSIEISAANRIRLSDRSRIETDSETDASSSGGGNITFKDIGILLLRDNSRISTESRSVGDTNTGNEGGDGGNIRIFDTDFVIAVPGEDNDILANAVEGKGGQITLTAEQVIGLTPRQNLSSDEILKLADNSISDISANSQFGEPGDVLVQNIADPIQNLDELPVTLSDASNEISEGCTANLVDNAQGEFIATGRGGLPPAPGESLSLPLDSVPWVSTTDLGTHSLGEEFITPSVPQTELIEAQGWLTKDDGQVFFIAEPQASEFLLSNKVSNVTQCTSSNSH